MRTIYITFFIILNYTALAIGGIATKAGVLSEWYSNIDKAPWTPPGWVFGLAWTIVMTCFGFYFGNLWLKHKNQSRVLVYFAIFYILNVAWNFLFFELHLMLLGLINLCVLLGSLFLLYRQNHALMRVKSLFLLPYILWMFIAISLNAYIYIFN